MADRITLQVARYRPEEDAAPDVRRVRGAVPQGLGGPRRAQLREGSAGRHALVPLVLPHGGLRQLRHDRQRRAEADLRDVPRRLCPRPDSRGTAQELSGHPRPHRRHRRFHAEADDGQAVDCPRAGEADCRGRVPPDAAGAGGVQAVQHVHQLHALLRGVPDLQPRPQVHRAGGDCAGAALQPGLARRGREGAARGALGARRDLGLHVCRRVHRRCARRTSIRPGPSSATSWTPRSTGSRDS